MTASVAAPGALRRLRTQLGQRFRHEQHQTAYYLTVNNLLGATTGLLFWLLLARFAGLDPAQLGIGYAMVALGTIVAVVAKGGLDTALLQKVPGGNRREGHRLLGFAFLVAATVAALLTILVAWGAGHVGFLVHLDVIGWVIVATNAILLLLGWLHDAYFVALGQARFSFQRTLVLSACRLGLPLPVIALGWVHPIPLTWALALGASAVAAALRTRRFPQREGRDVPRREFLASAVRNLSGGAAEFLPGLLLVPLVLALDGPASAAYFGIAWTGASLLFQTSAATGRSALAQMIRGGPDARASAIRKGINQNLWVVAPVALAAALFSRPLLGIFGPAYAAQGAPTLAILCMSAIVIIPTSLYLAVLRSRERSLALILFPAAMVAALAITAPALDVRYGMTGVALAWLLSNAPFGAYAAWRLSQVTKEVIPLAANPVVRGVDLE